MKGLKKYAVIGAAAVSSLFQAGCSRVDIERFVDGFAEMNYYDPYCQGGWPYNEGLRLDNEAFRQQMEMRRIQQEERMRRTHNQRLQRDARMIERGQGRHRQQLEQRSDPVSQWEAQEQRAWGR